MMEFFTWKLWRQLNSVDARTFGRAQKAWDRNRKAYYRQLKTLLPRFNERYRRFWRGDTRDLHDGQIVRVAVGDALETDLLAEWPKAWHSSAVIEVMEPDCRTLCTLKYGEIAAIEARLVNGGWSSGASVFETWGYDELVAEGTDAFRHNILFASGGELSIIFKRFTYRRQKLPNYAQA